MSSSHWIESQLAEFQCQAWPLPRWESNWNGDGSHLNSENRPALEILGIKPGPKIVFEVFSVQTDVKKSSSVFIVPTYAFA